MFTFNVSLSTTTHHSIFTAEALLYGNIGFYQARNRNVCIPRFLLELRIIKPCSYDYMTSTNRWCSQKKKCIA